MILKMIPWSTPQTILLRVFIVMMVLSGTDISMGQTIMHDSLAAYLELAAKNNPSVKAKFNEYLAAKEKAPQAGGLPDPEFSFGVFIKPMELMGGNQVADFQLMQMFPWFGSLRSARDEASLMAKAKFESFRDVKQEVFFNVRKAWLELYLNRSQISVTQKNLELLKAIERIALTRFSTSTPGTYESGSSQQPIQRNSTGSQGKASGNTAGRMEGGMSGGMSGNSSGSQTGGLTGSNMDQMPGSMTGGGMGQMGSSSDLISLYRIQIEMGDLENRLADWKSQQTVLITTMNSLLNRRSDMPVFLPDTLGQEFPIGSFLATRDSIWSNNTMLNMLSMEKQAFDERIRMSKRMSYPMFGLGIDYMLINPRDGNTSMMNGKDMFMPMGKITLPIYRGKYSAQRKEAEFLSMATANQISAMRNSLSVDYQNVLKRQNDAIRRIQLYTRQAHLAQKTLNLMIVEFSVSGTGLDELLKIEQQLLDYELLKISAMVENNIALATLDRLMAKAGVAQTE
ncbi:MAG: TolC family protein [Bacteroidales bacterium]|nr:TolC family protein [Bacteroidales bacterium]